MEISIAELIEKSDRHDKLAKFDTQQNSEKKCWPKTI